MATPRWLGVASPIAQVQNYTFAGTWEADDIIRAAFGTHFYEFTAGSTDPATIVASMVTVWNALNAARYPEFAEITASASGVDLILTADTAGKPFTCTLTPLEANGGAADAQTIEGVGTATTGGVTTASAGPNDWSTAQNWSTGAVPGADTAILENSSVDIRYGLAQSAVTLVALHILASYTGKVGLAEHNGTYYEYRDRYLAISATNIYIGQGTGTGSNQIRINTGSVAGTIHVYLMAASAVPGIEALTLIGTNITALNIYKGTVGVAVIGGEVATITTLRVGYIANVVSDALVRLGSGVTLTTVSQSGGDLTVNNAVTTITTVDGVLRIRLAATVTTLNLDGGTCYYVSTGTATTINVGNGGKLLFTQDMQGRTVTTCNIFAGSTVLDPLRTVTFTNGIDLERCSLADVTLDVGTHAKISVAAPS